MRKYNLYLAERQICALEEISECLGISVSEVIRRALDLFIETEGQKVAQNPLPKRDVTKNAKSKKE